MDPLQFTPNPTLTDAIRKGIDAHLEKANADAGGAHAISGEVVEIGDDETGQPRIVVHTTREAIKAYPTLLLFRRVTVAAENSPRAEPEMSPAPAMIQSIDSVDVKSIALQVANVFAREDALGVDEQGRAKLQRRIVETIFCRLGDDMVERGAKYLAASAGNMPAWESLGGITKDAFRRQARAVLNGAMRSEVGHG